MHLKCSSKIGFQRLVNKSQKVNLLEPPSLIRVFNVRSMGSWGSNLSSCGQRRLWSDWADARPVWSESSLGAHAIRLAHMSFVGFVTRRFNFYSGAPVSDYLKYLDSQVWANSLDPDQTASEGLVWSGSILFVSLSASFGHITALKTILFKF